MSDQVEAAANDRMTDEQIAAAVERAGSLIVSGGHPILDYVYRDVKGMAATIGQMHEALHTLLGCAHEDAWDEASALVASLCDCAPVDEGDEG